MGRVRSDWLAALTATVQVAPLENCFAGPPPAQALDLVQRSVTCEVTGVTETFVVVARITLARGW